MDVDVRQRLIESEQAIKDLEKSLAPMEKKLRSQSREEQEDFKNKAKLVDLIKEQHNTAKQNFEGGEIAPRRKVDPNAGLLANKAGIFIPLIYSVDWR